MAPSRNASTFLVVIFGLTGLGCASTEQMAGWLTTDSASYTASLIPGSANRFTFRVVARFENRGLFDLYLGRCSPSSPKPMYAVIDLHADMEAAYNLAWGCVGHDQQFRVRPGEVRVDTFDLQGPNISVGGVYRGELEGRFRIVYLTETKPGDGANYDAARGSNSFSVSVAR